MTSCYCPAGGFGLFLKAATTKRNSGDDSKGGSEVYNTMVVVVVVVVRKKVSKEKGSHTMGIQQICLLSSSNFCIQYTGIHTCIHTY